MKPKTSKLFIDPLDLYKLFFLNTFICLFHNSSVFILYLMSQFFTSQPNIYCHTFIMFYILSFIASLICLYNFICLLTVIPGLLAYIIFYQILFSICCEYMCFLIFCCCRNVPLSVCFENNIFFFIYFMSYLSNTSQSFYLDLFINKAFMIYQYVCLLLISICYSTFYFDHIAFYIANISYGYGCIDYVSLFIIVIDFTMSSESNIIVYSSLSNFKGNILHMFPQILQYRP